MSLASEPNSSNRISILNASISQIVGGEAGSGMYEVNGGNGGQASGINIFKSGFINCSYNNISNICGGLGNNYNTADFAQGGDGGLSSGIHLNMSNNNNIFKNLISSIYGGLGGIGGPHGWGGNGGLGIGIYLKQSSRNNITLNRINTIFGGNGNVGGPESGDWLGGGGRGGISNGLYIHESYDNNIITNYMYNISGGNGGNGGDSAPGGIGGDSYGFHLKNANLNIFYQNDIDFLYSGLFGLGTNGGPNGINGSIFGFFIEEDSFDNDFNISNTVGGDRIYWIYNNNDSILSNLDLKSPYTTFNFGKVVIIDSSNITLDNISLSNAYGKNDTIGYLGTGLFIKQTENVAINNVTINNIVGGSSTTTTNNIGGAGAGFYLYECNNITINNLTIKNITGGVGSKSYHHYCPDFWTTPLAGEGGDAYGVFLEKCYNISLNKSNVYSIKGGGGGDGSPNTIGGNGGKGIGIYLLHSNMILINTNIISDIIGGNGGNGGDNSNSGGTGGIGAGIYLYNSVSNSINENHMINITGGNGGFKGELYGAHGADQIGFGFYFEENSYQNEITDNSINGDPIIYCYNISNKKFENLIINSQSNPTNLGKVVVLNSYNITMKNIIIENFTGITGKIRGLWESAYPGQDAYGFNIKNSQLIFIENISISGIQGGLGGSGPRVGKGGDGGNAYILFLENVSWSTVYNVQVSNNYGGNGGNGGYGANGGKGGDVYGIYLTNCNNNSIMDVNIIFNYGGPGGLHGENGLENGTKGISVGVFLLYSETTNINNSTIQSHNIGINMTNSKNNILFHNNFINNTIQSYGGLCYLTYDFNDFILFEESPHYQFYVPLETIRIEIELLGDSQNFDLTLWDNQGVRTGGYTASNFTEVENIPNSQYSGRTTNPEWIIVEPPITFGIWDVMTYALDIGYYEITVKLFYEGNNDWDNGYSSGGNYWSDWPSPDALSGVNQDQAGSDGIVDLPYNILGGSNQDSYPFTTPNGWLNTPMIIDGNWIVSENTTCTDMRIIVNGNIIVRPDVSLTLINVDLTGLNLIVQNGAYIKIVNCTMDLNNLIINKWATVDTDPTTIHLAGSVFVDGYLLLDDTTLYMDCTYDGEFGIQVNNTAEITIRNKSTVRSNGFGNYWFRVNATAYLTITNSTIRDCGWDEANPGLVCYANGALIHDSTLTDNYNGITLMYASDCQILNNNISNNLLHGIYLGYSSNNNITNNIVLSNNGYGIALYSSSTNILFNNQATNNNQFGIILQSGCEDNIISHNNLWNHSDCGVYIGSCNNNDVNNNTASNSYCGIYIDYSSFNNITNNYVTNNDRGIFLWTSCNNNIISHNDVFSNQDYGIRLFSSNSNLIYHNNIINNPTPAFDNGINTWHNGHPSGGNYWSDWTTPDTMAGPDQNIPGSDGFVDNPPLISGGSNMDLYPFTTPNGWLTTQPIMFVEKWAPATAFNGDVITYCLNYTNIGTDTAYNVWINETYPTGVTIINCNPIPTVGMNSWFIGNVAPGASGTIFINVSVNLNVVGIITNSAILDYSNAAGIPQLRESTSVDTMIAFQLQLNQGWNLFSIPLIPPDPSLDAIFGDALTGGLNQAQADKVFKWDPISGEWLVAYLYEDGIPGNAGWLFVSEVFTLEPDFAYWVWVREDLGHPGITFNIFGAIPGERNVPLSVGWNLVGYTSVTLLTLQNGGIDSSGLFASGFTGGISQSTSDRVFNWDGSGWQVQYMWENDDASDGTWIGTTFDLAPGKGYWIEVREEHEEFVWTYGDSTAMLITDMVPIDGATDVAIDADIIVEFSEPMNTGTVTYACSPDPGGWSMTWDAGDTVATFSHSNVFDYSTVYTFEITGGTDVFGNPLAPGTVPNPSIFTTAAGLPYLAYIVITPSSVNLESNTFIYLEAQGYDQYMNPIACDPMWADSSFGGTFSEIVPGSPATARYTAGDTPTYGFEVDAISATDGAVVGYADLEIWYVGGVPEFHNIILPISAMLGLAFLAMRKKKKGL